MKYYTIIQNFVFISSIFFSNYIFLEYFLGKLSTLIVSKTKMVDLCTVGCPENSHPDYFHPVNSHSYIFFWFSLFLNIYSSTTFNTLAFNDLSNFSDITGKHNSSSDEIVLVVQHVYWCFYVLSWYCMFSNKAVSYLGLSLLLTLSSSIDDFCIETFLHSFLVTKCLIIFYFAD